MNIPAWNTKRRLVPRWRSLEQTARAGELTSMRRKTDKAASHDISNELTVRMAEWRRTPNLVSAAELVESAIVEGREEAAVYAARRLVSMEHNAAPLIRRQAEQLLVRTGHGSEVTEKPPAVDQSQVAFWRGRTRLNPRDALSWVELSLRHTINGHLHHAKRAMEVAAQLAPDNRHVLRSASRLHLHLGDPERAHDMIAGSAATAGDPWLMAAEISLSELADRRPRLAKSAKRLLEGGGLYPRLTTELAGALATMELIHGSSKPARKLFAQSMADPTGNALAQAEWASPLVGSALVPPIRFISVQEASEANAFHHFRTENYAEVAAACERWAAEEPYSIRPYEFGAAVAGLAGDYGAAEDFASRGLKMRSGSPKLINALAFALACSNRVEEAETALIELDANADDDIARYVSIANWGLIAFRKGAFEKGRARYDEAISGFRRLGHLGSQTTAKLYLAREAGIANQEDAENLAADATKAWRAVFGGLGHPVLAELDEQLRRLKDPARSAAGG